MGFSCVPSNKVSITRLKQKTNCNAKKFKKKEFLHEIFGTYSNESYCTKKWKYKKKKSTSPSEFVQTVEEIEKKTGRKKQRKREGKAITFTEKDGGIVER